MDNEVLKQAFRVLQPMITRDVDPDTVMDVLYANEIISATFNNSLCEIPDPKNRCRKLLLQLHLSPHPRTFVILREALRDEYPSIVDEIDQQVDLISQQQPSQTDQLQQLHLDQSTDGKFFISNMHNLLCRIFKKSIRQ